MVIPQGIGIFKKNIGGSLIHTLVEKSKYEKFIKESDAVIDFGGGFTLQSINCKRKYGIEINDSAIEVARNNGIDVYKNFDDLESDFFDVIFSNSALEHVENPYSVLLNCKRVFKNGGIILFSVPHEELSNKYKPNDINQHLYTGHQ